MGSFVTFWIKNILYAWCRVQSNSLGKLSRVLSIIFVVESYYSSFSVGFKRFAGHFSNYAQTIENQNEIDQICPRTGQKKDYKEQRQNTKTMNEINSLKQKKKAKYIQN